MDNTMAAAVASVAEDSESITSLLSQLEELVNKNSEHISEIKSRLDQVRNQYPEHGTFEDEDKKDEAPLMSCVRRLLNQVNRNNSDLYSLTRSLVI